MQPQRRRHDRRGVVAVEAAIVLPVLMVILFGLWEVSRIAHVNQLLVNAAREGARVAAGGSVNGVSVTTLDVTDAVQDYLRAAGLPTAAVTGSQVTLTNTSGGTWTNPSDAAPLDSFTVQVAIPPGAAFQSLKWNLAQNITSINQISASVQWRSTRDATLTVDTQLPR